MTDHYVASKKLIDIRPHGWDTEAYCKCGYPLHGFGDTAAEAATAVEENLREHLKMAAYDHVLEEALP